MNSTTVLTDHWVLDKEYSNKAEASYVSEIMMDTINSKIKERERSLNEKQTVVENKSDKMFFQLPDFNLSTTPNYKNYMSKSQNWIGHIIEIRESEFDAKLADKNNSNTHEIAIFELKEVSEGDLELLKIGAVFYWSIGYAVLNGQITKQSLIRFKRSIDLTESEFDHIVDKANDLRRDLNWD